MCALALVFFLSFYPFVFLLAYIYTYFFILLSSLCLQYMLPFVVVVVVVAVAVAAAACRGSWLLHSIFQSVIHMQKESVKYTKKHICEAFSHSSLEEADSTKVRQTKHCAKCRSMNGDCTHMYLLNLLIVFFLFLILKS